MTPSRRCASTKGSIMPLVEAISRIQLSGMIDIGRHAPVCSRWRPRRRVPAGAWAERAFLLNERAILKAAASPAAGAVVAAGRRYRGRGRGRLGLPPALLGLALLQVVAKGAGQALLAGVWAGIRRRGGAGGGLVGRAGHDRRHCRPIAARSRPPGGGNPPLRRHWGGFGHNLGRGGKIPPPGALALPSPTRGGMFRPRRAPLSGPPRVPP